MLPRVLNLVGSCGNDSAVAVRELAVRLLRASYEVAEYRSKLAPTQGAIDVLLDWAVSALECTHESAIAAESAESLLKPTRKIWSKHSGEESDATLSGRDAVVICQLYRRPRLRLPYCISYHIY
jgi:hypothetical protein